jgi:two-component system NtrC family sensor kinase
VSNLLLYEGLEKTNRELQDTQAQLVQSAKMAAVGQLGAGDAHELNNPLGGNLGYSQFMLEKLNRPDFGPEEFKSCRSYIESIERESIRCKKIITNLLKFSRKPQVDKPELIDLKPVIEETLSIMGHQLKLDNVTVKVDLKTDLVKVMGVVNLLQQVFTNLILNAQHAMTSGGDLIITADNIIDPITRLPRGVRLEFTDTGCGIPPENLTRIFEPFFSTKAEKGTGLGLSISYQIVQDHKGIMEVKSQVGRGTTFIVTLPASVIN